MKKAALIVADSEKCADLLYASGFRAPDPFIYFATAKHRGIILSVLEYDRGVSERCPEVEVFRYEDFIRKGRTGMGDVLRVLAKTLKVEMFVVPMDFPLALADFLRRHKIEVKCVKKNLFPQREFKSETEIELLRQALQVSEKAMKRAEDIIREATIAKNKVLHWQKQVLTSELLRAEINMELVRNGAFANSTIVAGGLQGAEPHNEGSGPLKAGEPIVIDIFPRVTATGYFGDITRTFLKGKAPKLVKKAYAAVKAARDESKKLIKAGTNPTEIHAFAANCLTEAGFPTGQNANGKNYGFFHGLGHGLGLEVHEAPRMNLRNSEPFRGGEVVTVEPGVYYPDWGGIRLEDVVVVRNDHAECLTTYPTELEID